MEVRNCKGCGRLFNYIGKTICPECLKVREDEFQKVKDYIRENPDSGISEVAEATEVSINQIRQWVREERLIFTAVSADSGINCEGCGRPIRTGRLCDSCKRQVTNDLTRAYAKPVPEKAPEKKTDKDRMRYLNK